MFVNRFLRDIRHAWLWVVGLGTATTVFALSGFLYANEPSYDRPQTDPAGRSPVYLRVLDPGASLITEYRTVDEASASVIDDPAMQALLAEIADDPRMSLLLPVSCLPADWAKVPEFDGDVLIGSQVPDTGASPQQNQAMVWGEPGVDTLYGLPVVHMPDSARPRVYFDGTGGLHYDNDAPLAMIEPTTALSLGVNSGCTLAQVVTSFVCLGCLDSDVDALAARLNETKQPGNGNRVYFSASATDVNSAATRLYVAANRLDRYQLSAAVVSLILTGLLGTQYLWRRRRDAYRIDLLAGAGAAGLHLRVQLIVALAVSLPTACCLIGPYVIGTVLNTTFTLAPQQTWMLMAAGPIVHIALGTPLALQTAQLIKNPER